MAHICEFCGHEFSNKNNLVTHTKTAKYCIDQRGGQSHKYACVCGKIFTRSHNLKVHENKCPIRISLDKEEELSELRAFKEEIVSEADLLRETNTTLSAEVEHLRETVKLMAAEIKELKEKNVTVENKMRQLEKENKEFELALENGKGQIKVYKERPGTVNNTQYNNPKLMNIKCDTIPPLTIENVKKEVDDGKYTYENYIRGEKGLVEFIAAIISEDDQRSYVCTDASRNKFHRLVETREWSEDNGANFLNKIFDQLKEPATVYYKKIADMIKTPDEQDTGDFLMDKTKRMFFGISSPKSKDRADLFNRIRSEVRSLASI